MTLTATKPRLGFLGVGWIGRQRLDAVRNRDVAEIAAVADPAVDGCLDSLDQLLELDLDGIVIATPSALHADHAIAALERGLAVFCQKPLARTAEETAAIVEAARIADRLLAVDLSYRHAEAARCTREVVRSGAIGDIHTVDLTFHNAYGPDKRWFYDPVLAGGGCVVDLGTHLIDLALWTLDWPRVAAVTTRLRGEPVEQLALAHIELAAGVAVRLACSWNLPIGRDCDLHAHFWGDAGGATFRNVDGSYYDFVAERHDRTSSTVLVAPPDEWGGRAIVGWAERLARGDRFDPDIEHAVDVARTLDRIYGRT